MELAIGYTCNLPESQDSVKDQEKAIRQQCDHLGLQLIGIHSNIGPTDFNALREIIKAQDPPPKHLVVSDLDRIAISAADAITSVRELENEFDIKVVDKIGQINFNAGYKQLKEHLSSPIFKEQARNSHSMRTKLGIQYAKERKGLKFKR